MKIKMTGSKMLPSYLESLIQRKEQENKDVRDEKLKLKSANVSGMKESGLGGSDEEDIEGEDSDDDILNPRNYYNNIYQNENFLQIRRNIENETIEQTKHEVERKHLIQDADRVLEELSEWKSKREK